MTRLILILHAISFAAPVWGYGNYALIFLVPWAYIQLLLFPLCIFILRETAKMYPATLSVPRMLPFVAAHIVLDIAASYIFFSVLRGRAEHNNMYFWYFLIMPGALLLLFVGFCRTSMKVRLLSVLILLAFLVLLMLLIIGNCWLSRN
jgi:hypothetical protein